MLCSSFSPTKMLKQSMQNVLPSKLSHLLFILLIFSSTTLHLVHCDTTTSSDSSTSSNSNSNSNKLSQSGISNSSSNSNSSIISDISSISLSSIINGVTGNGTANETSAFVDELSKLETVLFDYVNDVLTQNFFNVISSFTSSVFNTTLGSSDNSTSKEEDEDEEDDEETSGKALRRSFNERVVKLEKLFAKTRLGVFSSPRAVQTGRLFFFKGVYLVSPFFVPCLAASYR
jgi:hypothetical protein